MRNPGRLVRTILIACVAASSLASRSEAQADGWQRLASLEVGTPLVIHLDSEQIHALFRRASATHLYVATEPGRARELEARDVRAVYQDVPGPLVRRMLIGAAIAGGVMFYPCRVAPQAKGTVAECRASALLSGATFGLIYHFLNRSHLEAVYVASKEAKVTLVEDWHGESSDALTESLISVERD